MTNRMEVSNKIVDILAVFSRKLEILGANNELAWHTYAENIMIPILNLLFETNLTNSNSETSKSSIAIDLVDKSKRVAFQVTSDDSFSKIKSTIEKFVESRLYDTYDRLNFIFLKEKGRKALTHQQENELAIITSDKIGFKAEDSLLDFSRLYGLIRNREIEDIQLVVSKLEEELGKLSEEFKDRAPIVTFIFDEENDAEFAERIINGLVALGIRTRHFSQELESKFRRNGRDSDLCRILYDVNKESKTVVILGTRRLKVKLKSNSVNPIIPRVLDSQHTINYLFKLEENVSFVDFPLFKPIIFKASRTSFQFIIDTIVLELKKQNIVSEIKGYEDFDTIIRLYETKAQFSDLAKFIDSKRRIGYSYLEAVDKLKRYKTCYLYLYKGIYIKPTAEMFFKNNPDFKSRKETLIVILPKESGQKQLEDRIGNVSKNFRTNNVFYLDDFIWTHCTTDLYEQIEKVKFSHNKNYIPPELKIVEGSVSDFDQIENWVLSEHDPILIITGGGGIGKTTMARVIADTFQSVRTNSRVIFIEASDTSVMNGLLRISETRQIDLFDFYTVAFPLDLISRDLFRINIDNGNFLLIIDGLDEVFSKIPDFNVKHFIASVTTDFVRDIGVGKILLTCRSYFLRDTISRDTHVNHFEIEPFSRNHAKQFFESKFGYDEKSVSKSMEIIESLNPIASEERDKIMPYIVDVVAKIVESGDVLLSDGEDMGLYLNLGQKNDYVIYKILTRESLKTGQLTVEQQCKFFIYFSVFYDGRIISDKLQSVWSNHFNENLAPNAINALKSHPLLEEQGGSLIFKYDFFEFFFKSLYLVELLKPISEEMPSDNLIKILLSEGKFGSSLFFETANRCYSQWGDDWILRTSLLMDGVKQVLASNSNFNNKSLHQVISSLFALALMCNQSKYNSNTATNTQLLIKLFGDSKSRITGLSMINFSKHIRFDFSNLTFIDCYFEAYESFWDCTFKNSFFEDCSFFSMPIYNSSNSSEIGLSMFRNPRKDLTFDDYFEMLNERVVDRRQNVRMVLNKFLGLFYSNGHIQPQGIDSVLKRRFIPRLNKIVSLDEMVSILEDRGILKLEYSKISREKRAHIIDKYKEEIIQFTKEGTMSIHIKEIIDELN